LQFHTSSFLLKKEVFYKNKENPFTKVKSVAHYPNKKYLLSEQEIQDLLAFCNNIEHGWFWSCVIVSMRVAFCLTNKILSITC
jgi:hypothetical protein